MQAEWLAWGGGGNIYSAASYFTNHWDIYTAIVICNCRRDVPVLLPWVLMAETGGCDKLQLCMSQSVSDVYKLDSHHWKNCPTTNNYRRHSLPFPCLGYYSMWPTAPLTWGNPKPRLLERNKPQWSIRMLCYATTGSSSILSRATSSNKVPLSPSTSLKSQPLLG